MNAHGFFTRSDATERWRTRSIEESGSFREGMVAVWELVLIDFDDTLQLQVTGTLTGTASHTFDHDFDGGTAPITINNVFLTVGDLRLAGSAQFAITQRSKHSTDQREKRRCRRSVRFAR